MSKNWTESRIQNFITNEVEESLTLEYKAAEGLGKTDYQKKEITKDVSAMANAAGGLLIYGISEHQNLDKRHLPEKSRPSIAPIFRANGSNKSSTAFDRASTAF